MANPTIQSPSGLLSAPTAPTSSTAPTVNAPNALNSAQPMPWSQPVSVPTATPAQANAAQANAAQANATLVNPNALSEAVNRVADPNSLISQRARANANEMSNSAGLLNSSMAVGAAENAVLNQALPIAQGDVQAQIQNAQAQNQIATTNVGAQNQIATTNVGAQNQAELANTQAKNANTQAQLDQANKVQLAGINASYQNVLNTNNNASTLYNNSMSQISQIQNNPNMDANTKTAAINDIINSLHSGLNMYSGITGLNLAAGLNFAQPAGATPGTPAAEPVLGTAPPPAAPVAPVPQTNPATTGLYGPNNMYG